jgi:hypothetical protein
MPEPRRAQADAGRKGERRAMLRRISDLPIANSAFKPSYVEKDLREFARNNTYDIAEVIIEGHDGRHIAKCLRNVIKRNPEKYKDISAVRRNGRAFLVRNLER